MRRLVTAWLAITGAAIALRGDSAASLFTAPLRVADGRSFEVGLAVTTLVESSIYLALFAWLAGRPAVARLLGELSARWRTGVLVFVAALVFCQLVHRNRDTFPLVAWDMYGERIAGDVRYFEFTGIAHEREVELNFARELLALNRQVTFGLERLADRIDATPAPAARDELVRSFDATIRTLGRSYNDAHAGEAVRTVRVWRRTVPTDPFRGRDTIARELYREIAVGAEIE